MRGGHLALTVSRFRESTTAMIATTFLALMVALTLLAPVVSWIVGVDPYAIDATAIYAPPSSAHLLGTDDLGRDVLARLLLGGRVSLIVAITSAVASMGIGFAVGLVAGYYGGLLDAILMRFAEVMWALPRLPLMIFLCAIDLEKLLPNSTLGSSASIIKLIFIIVLFGWMNAARLARASTLQLRKMDFITAARALGASDGRIIARHIVPNAFAPVLVAATLDLGAIIVYESVLSYLGLGVSPPEPSWGAMLSRGMTYLHSAPLLLILPGLLTFLTVAAFNVAGDALRDALDPRSRYA